MTPSDIASYASLGLAVLFWWLSSRQANTAKKTLNDIKTEIVTWQAQLNKAAIEIISSRPEIIAKETALEESRSLREFSSEIVGVIKDISSKPLPVEVGGGYQLEVLDRILRYHNALFLGKEQLVQQAAIVQSVQNIPHPEAESPRTEQKKKEGNDH
ncbi:MAG: hypothetical protein PHX61_14480 [Alphaproteobacteria bacterium]|nr:hypothetical protein [Alphaproteobacteria bacterium]